MKNSPTFNPQITDRYYEQASYSWSSDSVRYMNTVSAHTRACYLYMQECGYFKTTFPYFTERASLPSYLLLYTVSGTGLLTYEKKKYLLEPGSCFYIDCRKPHRYEIAGNSSTEKDIDQEVWEFLWIHFYGVSSEGYYEEFAADHIPVIQIQDAFLIESSLRRILAVNRRKAVYAEVLTANLIHNLITELIIQKMTDFNGCFHITNAVNSAAAFIQVHYMEDISLEMVAKHVNLSIYHLSKEFSRYMGISINQYVINCRISRSKELLRESDLSVSEIAFQVGIQHVSHFIRLFKDREGVTPLQYRKLW